ncbi:MAG: PH domain-containing protein [Mycobacteriales bacterium]
MAVLRFRPQRLRQICWVSAAGIVVGFFAMAFSLHRATGGGGSLRAGDRSALAGVGIILAVGVLALARPLVEADEHHVRVRNVIGSYDLTWDLVRAVRFGKGSPWASLELAHDERIPVMAVQSLDGLRALEAITALRGLLAASRAGDGQEGAQSDSPRRES